MQKFKVKIELISDTLIGSGEGYGAIIDSDVVLDEVGIPYLPARRIKGLLRDSAEESIEILENASVSIVNKEIIGRLFGESGEVEHAPFSITNFVIEEYEKNYDWLKYFINDENFKKYISKESIVNSFTNIRKQTSIDEIKGTAKNNSLRTIRVINKGLTFSGDVEIFDDNPDYKKLLLIACNNLRHLGTKRKRGFGEVECTIRGELNDWFISELEGLCIN